MADVDAMGAGEQHGNGVEARGPLGFFVRIAGRQVVILTLIVAIASTFAFAWWSWVSSPRSASAGIDGAARLRNPEVKAEHDFILKGVDRIERQQRITNYLLSLPTDERPRLKPPDELGEHVIVVAPRRRPVDAQ